MASARHNAMASGMSGDWQARGTMPWPRPCRLPPVSYDAIVLGAGGAGLMCAAVAGQRGRRVLLIDHAERAGKKILISGGGRCNFTNVNAAPERFLSANPHFAKSALGRYRPEDFIALVDRHRIAWHEKTLGQLFCDGSARQIVHMLMEECAKGGVRISLGKAIARREPRRRPVHRPLWRRDRHGARSGDRHRRPLHPEDGRDRLRLRSGAAVRARRSSSRAPPWCR